jgi:poly(A) polymerase
MQPRFAKTKGKRWKRILNEPRFRAAYDFLLFRVVEDVDLEPLAEFWTKAQEDQAPPPAEQEPPRRRQRRGPRRRSRGRA